MKKALHQEIEKKLNDIDDVLTQAVTEKRLSNVNLGGGIALFFFYRYRQTSSEAYLEIANNVLEEAIDNIGTCKANAYCGGIAGVGWLIEHLIKENFIESENSILEEMDLHLLDCLNNDMSYKFYDFLHGGISYGFYFLSRTNSKIRDQVLYNLVTCLSEIAIIEGCQVKWCDFIYEKDLNKKQRRNKYITDENKFNLGLSHGVPSITAFFWQISVMHRDDHSF